MKHKTFVSLIALLILAPISFIGCNDDGGGGSSHGTQALTEIDFANDPSLQADPDNQTIVDFLESPSSDTPQNDTGPVGIDEIPITYPQTETHTFCWEDDNSDAMDYMVLLDSQGEEVLRVDVNEDCVTDTIEAGDYVMELHHDGSTGDTLPIFIIPNPDQNQQARKTDGLFNGFKVEIAKILRGIQNFRSKDARAQALQPDRSTRLSTYKCYNCFLEHANFYQADLTGADLRDAFLNWANFNGATLVGADLRGADLRNAIFYEANLTDIKLTICRDNKGPYCGLFTSDRYYIKLSAGATFLKATWCDGQTTCVWPSVGTCCIPPPIASLDPLIGCKPKYLPTCPSFDVIPQ
jgi:hypothetical protein